MCMFIQLKLNNVLFKLIYCIVTSENFNNKNNNPSARITSRKVFNQKLNILLEWP